MARPYDEPVFDALIALATGFVFVTYMFGVLLDPVPAIVVGIALVGVGTVVVPRGDRPLAAIVGLVAVSLGGLAIPRYVVSATGVGDELSLSIVLSGLVLLATFAVLRLTTFGRGGA